MPDTPTTHSQDVQQAIADIAVVKRAIDAARADSPALASVVGKTKLGLQLIALILATALIGLELLTGHANSQMLGLSAVSASMAIANITMAGLILAILVVALLFIVRRASKAAQSDWRSFIARNFTYLRNLALLSDLLVKFALVALLIHLRQPQWVAPLLFLFLGDYLLQGRFFTLSLRPAIGLGLVCIALGIAQAYYGSGLLIWPLVGFVIVCGASVVQLARRRKASVPAVESTP